MSLARWLHEALVRLVLWLSNIHDDPDRKWVLVRDEEGHPSLVEEYKLEEAKE